jgi:predicted DNA-binding protein (MmcQ/YjbR family)
MNLHQLQEYCMNKKGVEETMPFDEETLVYKVMGKMFALCGMENVPLSANLKCDPERALELRELFHQIIPGWHMNKKHWNTIETGGDVSDTLFFELIDHSYDLVVAGLPKKLKIELDNLE